MGFKEGEKATENIELRRKSSEILPTIRHLKSNVSYTSGNRHLLSQGG